MILKQLKNSLDYLIDDIYNSKDDLYEYRNIVSLDVIMENKKIDLVIDDLWSSTYTYQIFDFSTETPHEDDRDRIRKDILLNINTLYNDLRILVNNTYNYINTNMDDIIAYIKEYKKVDIYYLGLDVVNGQITGYLDTVTQMCYTYDIFDTHELEMIEEIENRKISDNELKDLILNATKEKIAEWNFLLENFENEESGCLQ